jgi:HAD superfamily phosphatase (TIGR01668 family)
MSGRIQKSAAEQAHVAEAEQREDADRTAMRPPEGASPGHPERAGALAFCPHRMVDAVTQIAPEELKGRGIEGLILDLDNTLVLWRKEEMTEEVLAWLQALQQTGIQLCILSNSLFGKRSARMAERLGCHCVRGARKPGRRGFLRAMAEMKTSPARTAIVGDQMFTDILGGNRSGIYTIMVRPLHRREFIYTKFVSRPPERLLLRWFRKRGHI